MDVPKDVREQVFRDLETFIRAVANTGQTPDDLWMFRGHADASWFLQPKIDRPEYIRYRTQEGIDRLEHEKRLLKTFVKWGTPHLDRGLDQWELIAIAQHHYLATRLLDWTANPLTALFFAVEEDHDADLAVWSYKHKAKSWTSFADGPLAADELVSFDPPHVTSRITAQGGKFTVHPPGADSHVSPWPGMLMKLVFKSTDRLLIRLRLHNLGISRAALFPDLDGIAATLNAAYRRTI